MSAFPFDSWLRLSVTVFHLSPQAFWAMSVRDWLVLVTPQAPDISAKDIRELMKHYPDKESGDGL